MAEWSTAAGFVLHTGALVADWVIDGHYPLFSLRETLSFLAWALVALYALVLYRYRAQAVGAFTMPLISVLTFVALLIGTDPAMRRLRFRRRWLFPIHTTLLIFAYAAFFIVFMASVMYLLQERELKLKTFGAIFHRLPPLTTVNELATSAAALGLTLLTLGIVTGMIWSSTRSGRFWHNDPKEIFAVLTWVLYFVLDHLSFDRELARTQCRMAGRRRFRVRAFHVFWRPISRWLSRFRYDDCELKVHVITCPSFSSESITRQLRWRSASDSLSTTRRAPMACASSSTAKSCVKD